VASGSTAGQPSLRNATDRLCIRPWLQCLALGRGGAHGLHGARVVVRRQVTHKQRGPSLVVRVVPGGKICISISTVLWQVAHKQHASPLVVRIVPDASDDQRLSDPTADTLISKIAVHRGGHVSRLSGVMGQLWQTVAGCPVIAPLLRMSDGGAQQVIASELQPSRRQQMVD
jgi:hypothetical protein